MGTLFANIEDIYEFSRSGAGGMGRRALAGVGDRRWGGGGVHPSCSLQAGTQDSRVWGGSMMGGCKPRWGVASGWLSEPCPAWVCHECWSLWVLRLGRSEPVWPACPHLPGSPLRAPCPRLGHPSQDTANPQEQAQPLRVSWPALSGHGRTLASSGLLASLLTRSCGAPCLVKTCHSPLEDCSWGHIGPQETPPDPSLSTVSSWRT